MKLNAKCRCGAEIEITPGTMQASAYAELREWEDRHQLCPHPDPVPVNNYYTKEEIVQQVWSVGDKITFSFPGQRAREYEVIDVHPQAIMIDQEMYRQGEYMITVRPWEEKEGDSSGD